MSIFASRAVLPVFVVAIVARFPVLVSWLPFAPDPAIVLGPRVQWLTSDACRLVLGALGLVEARADAAPDVAEWLSAADPHVKGSLAVVTTFGLADGRTRWLLATPARSPDSPGGATPTAPWP